MEDRRKKEKIRVAKNGNIALKLKCGKTVNNPMAGITIERINHRGENERGSQRIIIFGI